MLIPFDCRGCNLDNDFVLEQMSIFKTADVHLKGGECSLGSTYVYESASISVLLGLIMTKANFSGVLANFYLLA